MKTYYAASVAMVVAASMAVGGGAPRKEDIPKYIKMLAASKPADKKLAADMIGKRGAINAKDVEPAVDPLKNLAQKDSDAGVRKAAIHALGSIAPEPTETVPLLIRVLKADKSEDVKFAAVEALGRFGPEAKSALPALREFSTSLKDDKKGRKFVQAATMAINGTKK